VIAFAASQFVFARYSGERFSNRAFTFDCGPLAILLHLISRIKLLGASDGSSVGMSCYFTCPEMCLVISNMVTCFLPPKTALSASSALISVFFFAS
jgi:hypothetical protein